jgi:hypothetical protein
MRRDESRCGFEKKLLLQSDLMYLKEGWSKITIKRIL